MQEADSDAGGGAHDWRVDVDVPADATRRYRVYHQARVVSGRQALEAMIEDPSLPSALDAWIAAAPFRALRFETPALTTSSADSPFEFVLIDAPSLDRPACATDFAEHFATQARVVDFPNLSGDAHLVVPTPPPSGHDLACHAHLAAFARGAAPAARTALWRAVGRVTLARIGQQPRWLSTAGDGVPWLHVRLDSRPKYYRYRPYTVC